MKKIYLLLVAFLVLNNVIFAQLAVTVTGTATGLASSYSSLATAITALNSASASISTPIVITCAAGSETAPSGGYSITATGTITNTIKIVGAGAASSIITANTTQTAGSLTDAIIKIIGGDYITIDGFTLKESANTTTAFATNNMTEFGLALFYATTTNGAQNNTIQNCTISLNRIYNNTFGIYSNSIHSATVINTAASATTTTGGNSGLKVYSNNISNVNIGIVYQGPTAAADANSSVDIGGASTATGNIISNFGTNSTLAAYQNLSQTINGILVRNTTNYNISYNTITSSNGGLTGGTTPVLRGIWVAANSSSTAYSGTLTQTINNNSISLKSGVLSGTINSIQVDASTSSPNTTASINANDFNATDHTVAGSTGAISFITNAAIVLNSSINNNTFTNMSCITQGAINFINNNWSLPTSSSVKTVNSNSIVTGFAKTSNGGIITLFYDFGSSVTGSNVYNNNNNFSNITATGNTIIAGWVSTDGGSPTKEVKNNVFSNWSTGTGTITGLKVGFSGLGTVFGNTISNLTNAGSITGIEQGGVTTQDLYDNTIHTLKSNNPGTVNGILLTGGTTNNIYRNKIYNLEGTHADNLVYGINVTGGTTNTIYNNIIGELKASVATAATGIANQLIGLNINGGTTNNVYHNTVLLNGSSSGTNFGSSALFASTSTTFNLRNNILINNSTASGTGFTVAYRRSTSTLTSYANTSNNNLFYAGTPSASNLIFNDGTNSDQTLANYQSRVTTSRDANSYTENTETKFISVAGSNADFLRIASGNTAASTSFAESGGVAITTPNINNDYWLVARPTTIINGGTASTVDIGASEFDGVPAALPCSTPTAQPTALTFSSITTTSISGSFAVASPAAGAYLVVRSISSPLSSNPVDGTNYLVGASVGGGTVVANGTSTSFTDNLLSAGTLYYYFVFSYNSSSCTGGPKYLIATSPLTASQPTLCSAATSFASSNITPSTVTLTWTGTGNYIVEYNSTSASAGAFGTGATAGATGTIASSTATTPYVLSGLTAGTTYNIVVRQVCALGGLYSANTSTVISVIPSCTGTPTALTSSAITTTTATISWTASSPTPASGYEYYVSTSSTAPVIGTMATGTTAVGITTASLTSLSPNTQYYYWIRSNCNGINKGTWSSQGTFTTACANVTIFPSVEPFNTYLPSACWTEGTGLTGTAPTTVGNSSTSRWVGANFLNVLATGSASAVINIYNTPQTNWLISPTYTLNSSLASQLKYSVGATNFGITTAVTNWEADDFVETMISTDNGVTWTLLKTYNNTNVPSNLGQLETINLSTYQGQTVKFAFKAVEGATNGAADLDLFIDNFTIEVTPEPIIITPSSATICNGSSTSLTASSSNIGYTYTWSPSTGLNTTTGATVTANPTTTTTYTVTGVETATTKTTTQTITITVNPNVSSLVLSPTSASYCNPGSVALTASAITNNSLTISGTGATTSSTAAVIPYRQGTANTNQCRIQYLITKAELNSLGFTGGNINSIGFNITSLGAGTLNNFTISMGHVATTVTNLNSTYQTPTFTQVFNPINYSPTLGSNIHTFNTAFNWNGTDNIVVNICHVGGSGSSSTFSVATTAFNSVGSAASASQCTSSSGGAITTIRPIMTISVSVSNPITWSPSSNLSAISGSPVTANPMLTTKYYATATHSNGCTKVDSVTVTVNPRPTSVVSGGGTVCSGSTLPNVSIALTGIAPWNITYTDGSTPTTITGTTTNPYIITAAPVGTYTVTALSDASCTSIAADRTGSAIVASNPRPTAVLSGGGTVCAGDPLPNVSIALTGTAPWTIFYTINGGGSITASTSTSPFVITGAAAGTYGINLISDANCNSIPAGISGSAVVVVTAVGTWTGATSTDWNTASNWCGGVPTSSTNVVIPSAPTNQPTISSASPAAIANNITISSGAILTNASGGLLEVNGSVSNNGAFNSAAGDVSFNGTVAQTVPALNVNNFKVNNPAGLTLTAPVTVNGTLNFTDGIINTTTSTIINLAPGANVSGTIDNTRFVNGPITKCGNTAFTFPIGQKGTPNRVGLASIANLSATDCYTAQYFQTPYSDLTVSGALTGVSTGEYWDISRVGATTADVTLNWTDNIFSGVNAGNFDLAKLTMAHFNSTSTFWEVQSTSSLGGTFANGSITALGVSSFSPFALGSITATTLPLAVNSFTATKQNSNTNSLNWRATCTGASVTFELQRSTNGVNFVGINTLTATQARCAAPFNYVDNYNATSPITYYKLKVISNTGEVKYSQIIAINNKNSVANIMALYPNITKDNAVLVVESKTTINANFIITDAKGAIVRRFTENLSAGANAYPINVSTLSKGSYQISSFIDGALKTIRFIKE
jgi:hypothetical protein